MELSSLAVPFSYALLTFLCFSSQLLFYYIPPGPLDRSQAIRFNLLHICIFVSYTRCVFVDPGKIPAKKEQDSENGDEKSLGKNRQRWCRKCEAVKPPRAHHCKVCKRCVPKMDHHCPWTANCVSHTTFPPFIRFLFYGVVAMLYLWKFLLVRMSILWNERHLPFYLGPSGLQIAHLFLLGFVNGVTLFAISILLIRNIWCLAVNTTTIEGWEIERHKTLVRRARHFGGYLEGPEGIQVRIEKQEFPYDVGIWENCKQGMGTGNVPAWFWPFAATPRVETGLSFPTNGFSPTHLTWPPPDPDRLSRRVPKGFDKEEENSIAFTYRDADLTPRESIAAFKQRQEADFVRRRRPFVKRLEARMEKNGDEDSYEYGSDAELEEDEQGHGSQSGEEGWRNSEGERLRDFGVDEDIEFYDEEDDLPLSELIRRRKAQAAAPAQ